MDSSKVCIVHTTSDGRGVNHVTEAGAHISLLKLLKLLFVPLVLDFRRGGGRLLMLDLTSKRIRCWDKLNGLAELRETRLAVAELETHRKNTDMNI